MVTRRRAALVLAAALLAHRAAAQGLPPYLAVNPVITSRSGLFFQPYVDPTHRWNFRLLTDYASVIEYSGRPTSSVVLDAELLRLDATVIRNTGRGFIGASASLNGAYNGFLDGVLNWYHRTTGLQVKAREIRPNNVYDYAIKLPNGDSLVRNRPASFLGDVRLLGGYRHTSHWQTTVAVTLPTGPTGFGRKVASATATTTVRGALDRRWTAEVGFGAGYTPTFGDLSTYQHTTFTAASTGLRFRFAGRQAMFVNLFYQSPNYHDTGTRALDNRELTLDYGFLLKARRGPEWFFGMTEDLEPKGPAIDLSLRIGARW